MSGFTESVVEDAALAWLEALGYRVLHGPEISPGGDAPRPPPSPPPRPLHCYARRARWSSTRDGASARVIWRYASSSASGGRFGLSRASAWRSRSSSTTSE